MKNIKKYELVAEDAITVLGVKLFRIRALITFTLVTGGVVEKGDLGGYIEKEENLSHDGNAWVFDNAKVCGYAKVFDNAKVYGNAWVCGDAKVYGNAEVGGNANIKSEHDYITVKGLGSKNRTTTFFKTENNEVYVKRGCFIGNLAEFEKQVKETHKNTKYAKEYLTMAQVVKIHFEIGD